VRRPQELGALGGREIEHVLVERVAPELERGHGRANETAGLGGLGVVVHALVVEPVAQPFLGQLLALHVLPERQAAGEEHRRELGRRLAHLGVEELAFLDHEHAELGRFAAQEQGG
jgi:hypothetical protein